MNDENESTGQSPEEQIEDAEVHGGTPLLVKVSTVKAYLKAKSTDSIRIGGDFVAAFNDEVARLLDRAWVRCADNGRKTVRPSDL